MYVQFASYRTFATRYLTPLIGKVTLLFLLLLAGITLQLVGPRIVRDFIDAVISPQAANANTTLAGLALLFLAISLLKYGVKIGETYLREDVGWRSTNALRADLTQHCLRLEMDFHNRHTPGELIERVDGDVSKLAHFFSQLVVQVFGNLLLMIGILIALYFEDWRIGIAYSGFSLLAVLLMARMRNFATAHMKAQRQASADLFGFIEERLGGTEDIRANGAVAYTMHRLYRYLRELWRLALHARGRSATASSLVVVWFEVGAAIAFLMGAWLYNINVITIGTIYLFYAYVRMLMTPLMKLTNELQELQEAGASLLRIEELLNMPQAIVDGQGGRLADGPLAVAFTDVEFGYNTPHTSSLDENEEGPTQDDRLNAVLHKFNLTLEPQRTLGLLGRTGSGKTTIARLLLRLYDPQSGSVQINGISLIELSLSDLHRKAPLDPAF